MSGSKKLTGFDFAFVNTQRAAPDHVVQVYEGQALPKDLADGELERLRDLGAFDEHPRDVRARELAAAVPAGEGLPIPVPEPGLQAPAELADEVPDASVESVIAWVRRAPAGEDAADGWEDRASDALAVEQAKDKPRQGLVDALEGALDTASQPA